jgi:hypothetical protein
MKTRTVFLLAAALLGVFTATGCNRSVANRVPVGERFPSVQGRALSGERLTLPDAISGEVAILIVAYRQNAQFDCDRWLNSLAQFQTPVVIYEVPTITGWAPRQFESRIDEGMRSGIPKSQWGSVVTVYRDGHMIRDLTGNERGRNARVMLLDTDGKIVWFHDQGYGTPYGVELDRKARELVALRASE